MDGGSGLNILYAWTYDAMGLPRAAIRPTRAPIYRIVPRIRASLLGRVAIFVTFGGWTNFCMKTLIFEVMELLSAYQAILG